MQECSFLYIIRVYICTHNKRLCIVRMVHDSARHTGAVPYRARKKTWSYQVLRGTRNVHSVFFGEEQRQQCYKIRTPTVPV